MENFSEKKSYYLKLENFQKKSYYLKWENFQEKKSHTTSNGIWKNTKNAFHYIFPFGEGDNKKKNYYNWSWWQRAEILAHFQYGSFVGRGAEVKETHNTWVVGMKHEKIQDGKCKISFICSHNPSIVGLLNFTPATHTASILEMR